jgi:hypothetical protein
MQPQPLTAFMGGPGELGGGVLHQSFTTPSSLASYNIDVISGGLAAKADPLGAYFSLAELDVTGASLRVLPEHLAYRLACILYVCLIPQAGLKGAYESLSDIFDWYTRPIQTPYLPNRQELFIASTMTEVKAPPMVFDED